MSPALTNLKYAAGETAVGYPSQQDGLWVCVCGRPNTDETEYCVRCGRDRKTIFTRFSPEAVEAQISMKERQLDLNSRSMREDTIRLQRIREEEYRQKKDRRGSRIRTGIAVIAATALTAGAFFFASPWLRLCAGRSAFFRDGSGGDHAVFRARLTGGDGGIKAHRFDAVGKTLVFRDGSHELHINAHQRTGFVGIREGAEFDIGSDRIILSERGAYAQKQSGT